MFMPDIDPPWVAKLFFIWVLIGPTLVFLGARRGGTFRALLVCASGACLAIVAMNLLTWGWPTTQKFREGLLSWWWWMAYPGIVIGASLAVLAGGLGYASRWIFRPKAR